MAEINESALKALVAKRENVTTATTISAKRSVTFSTGCCCAASLTSTRPSTRELTRCQHALSRREGPVTVPTRQARAKCYWTCYAEARHASTVVLRALGGPDSGLFAGGFEPTTGNYCLGGMLRKTSSIRFLRSRGSPASTSFLMTVVGVGPP